MPTKAGLVLGYCMPWPWRLQALALAESPWRHALALGAICHGLVCEPIWLPSPCLLHALALATAGLSLSRVAMATCFGIRGYMPWPCFRAHWAPSALAACMLRQRFHGDVPLPWLLLALALAACLRRLPWKLRIELWTSKIQTPPY